MPAFHRPLLLALALGLSLLGLVGTARAAEPATVWACLPGTTPNPCDESLETTYLSSTTLERRKVASVETPAKDADRPVDCFYVYPTVVSLPRVNAPRYVTKEVNSILEYQASRFSQVCEVYAPVYRQATLFGIVPSAIGNDDGVPASFALAYSDVKRAWLDYLAHHNDGRGVVLIGHSQGSAMLIRLMRELIDGDPAVRSRVVSAVVPGGNLTVKKGERTGGDFDHIPTCASKSETGCVMAWSLFASSPGRSTLFGKVDSTLRGSTGIPNKPGTEVVCTNPAVLSGDRGRFDTLTRSEPFPGLIGIGLRILYWGLPPRAGTPWISPGERYKGVCRTTKSSANVLLVRSASPRTVLPLEAPWPDWGLHLADLNLPLGNVIEVVRSQIQAYAAANPS